MTRNLGEICNSTHCVWNVRYSLDSLLLTVDSLLVCKIALPGQGAGPHQRVTHNCSLEESSARNKQVG